MVQPAARPPATSPWLLPVLATATYLAAVIAAWGLTSLVLDRDPIDYPDAGPLLGPAIVAAACVVTFACLWRITRTRARSWVLAALAGSFVAMLLVGAIGYATTRADAVWLLLAAGHLALSPFVLEAAVLAALTAALVRAFGRTGRSAVG